MTVSPYLNNFHQETYDLHESLLIESIQMYGMDVTYIPREMFDVDTVFGEPAHSSFNKGIVIEAYLTDQEGFGGEGDLLSKFGVEIRDQTTFWIARKRFSEEAYMHNMANTAQMFSNYPREGDLIHLPMNGNIFQIMFVENETIFYPMGQCPLYEITVELFEYSGETFNTGNAIIDHVAEKYHVGNTAFNQPADNVQFNIEQSQITDFTEDDPFSEKY